MMKTSMLLLVAIAACSLPPQTEERGATILVKIDPPNSSYVTSESTNPSINIDTTAMAYTFAFIVETENGEIEAKSGNSTTYTDTFVTDVDGTLTLPGFTFPESTYDMTEDSFGRDFTRHDPITIPSTFMGQSFTVHMQGTDNNGLRSNVVDFSVLLD